MVKSKWIEKTIPWKHQLKQSWTGKGKFVQQMVLCKLGIYVQKNEVEPYTIYKNELKMNQRPKCKRQNYKTLRKHGRISSWQRNWQWFLKYATRSSDNKIKNSKLDFKVKNVLWRSCQESEKITYRMGGNVCKSYIW